MTDSAEDLYGDRLGAGALVGEYLIDELVAEGGFASLYRARHLQAGAPAAVKVLRRDFAVSMRMLKRFFQEAWTVRQIRHPHIVALYELGSLHDGRPFLAMEWLEGRNLADELRVRGPLGLAEILDVAEQIGSALSSVHAAGIVHRDLKAQNVMALSQTGGLSVKVVDFGIAKLLDPPEDLGQVTTTTILGTPRTMAPEQIRHEPVDARTDIYAFGLLLFQLATGALPFDGVDFMEIEDKHLHAPPPRASERAPVPPAFDDVIARCLQKDKAARYPSVDELLAHLRRVAAAPRDVRGTCIGVHLTASAGVLPGAGPDTEPDTEIDDALLDEIDALLDTARTTLEQAGLRVALESGNALLCVAPLAGTDLAGVLRAALALASERVAIAVHVAEAELSSGRYTGGELFHLGVWTGQRSPAGTVVVSRAAAAQLADPALRADPRLVTS